MSAERKGWDPDEVVKLRQMVALHKSAAEIAARPRSIRDIDPLESAGSGALFPREN